jgi:metallo-beta-lactamase family protein
MTIISYGAAETVTGSCHLIEIESLNFIIDCGLFQGGKNLNKLNYEDFLFNPENLDFVILTHSHIDHCGLLPKLVKCGFSGHIYATEITADLLSIMLQDTAYINEKDTEHENRRRLRQGKEPREPLYKMEDVEKTMPLVKGYNYNKEIKINDNVTFCFRDAGHILGSAIIELFITENNKEKKIVFSGDLGQKSVPIIQDPSLISTADYVYIESTYGDRIREEKEPRKEVLFQYIKKTIERGGKLLIPSFALERTQELLYILSELKKDNHDFPDINIYLDSPLAIKITEVFKKHPEVYDEEAASRKDNPFDFPGFICTPSVSESIALNNLDKPAIIIAGSGMCNGGRIRHHFKHGIWDAKNTVLFIGYQAIGTLGRIILDGTKEIKMMGSTFAVKAEIARINSFSAHADQSGLTNWLKAFTDQPEKVFLVHGEKDAIKNFSIHLDRQGFNTVIPQREEPQII